MKANAPVNPSRIAADIAALAEITETDRPWTRRAFTPTYLRGREWLSRRMREAGLEVSIDHAGNLIGRLPGRNAGAGTLMIGSHSDTVPEGGRFDGIAGVVAGIEIARSLSEQGVVLEHDLEIVDFLAEEVSIFGVSCIGSRGMIGELPQDWLRREIDGRTLAAAIGEVGGDAARQAPRRDVKGFLELHIEQGPVLEADGGKIGIVTAIAGITRIAIVVKGRADHAGTTPMSGRDDALVSAARLTLAIREWAEARATGAGHFTFTATVGEFQMEPNAANVVPALVDMLVDARASERSDMDDFLSWLTQAAAELGAETRVISDNLPRHSDLRLCDRLEQAADAQGISHRRIVSGAGHDAAWIGKIAPAAMVFVPCRGGRSHCPEEWAETLDIALGAAVLFHALQQLDRDFDGSHD